MAIVLRRALVIPMWAVVFCVVALMAPAQLPSSVTALLGIAVIALTMTAMFGWWRARTLVEAVGTPALRPDTLDLLRMDDDGAWQAPPRMRRFDGSRD